MSKTLQRFDLVTTGGFDSVTGQFQDFTNVVQRDGPRTFTTYGDLPQAVQDCIAGGGPLPPDPPLLPTAGWLRKIALKLYPGYPVADPNFALWEASPPTEIELRLASIHTPLIDAFEISDPQGVVSRIESPLMFTRIEVQPHNAWFNVAGGPNTLPPVMYGLYPLHGNEDVNQEYFNAVIQDEIWYQCDEDADMNLYLKSDIVLQTLAVISLWIDRAGSE
jgi:hypothetical protein